MENLSQEQLYFALMPWQKGHAAGVRFCSSVLSGIGITRANGGLKGEAPPPPKRNWPFWSFARLLPMLVLKGTYYYFAHAVMFSRRRTSKWKMEKRTSGNAIQSLIDAFRETHPVNIERCPKPVGFWSCQDLRKV